MTVEEFRSNPALVGAMRELVSGSGESPTVLAQAIVAVQSKSALSDAADNDPEIASVRRLSRAAEREIVLSELLSCAEPLPLPEPDEQQTWGVDLNKLKPSR